MLVRPRLVLHGQWHDPGRCRSAFRRRRWSAACPSGGLAPNLAAAASARPRGEVRTLKPLLSCATPGNRKVVGARHRRPGRVVGRCGRQPKAWREAGSGGQRARGGLVRWLVSIRSRLRRWTASRRCGSMGVRCFVEQFAVTSGAGGGRGGHISPSSFLPFPRHRFGRGSRRCSRVLLPAYGSERITARIFADSQTLVAEAVRAEPRSCAPDPLVTTLMGIGGQVATIRNEGRGTSSAGHI